MTKNILTDEELMRSLQKGDSMALIHLYERHSQKIWTYLNKRVPKEFVEDLFQDSLVKIVEKKDNWNNQPFVLWLYVVIRNIVNDHYREGKIEKRMLNSFFIQTNDANKEDFEDMISHIPTESSKLLTEYFKEGWSYEELANKYELSEATLRKRLSRALGILKKGAKNE